MQVLLYNIFLLSSVGDDQKKKKSTNLTSIWLIVMSRNVAPSRTLIRDLGPTVPRPMPVPRPENMDFIKFPYFQLQTRDHAILYMTWFVR